MIKLNDNNNRNYKQKEKLLLIGVSLLILSIHLMHINKLGIFYVLDDEFGYWSNAAYLAGYDWSSATSNIAYYSYGYSILLVPLFWIFDNPIHMYRAAIVLNAVMMSGSFLICYDMAKKLARGTNRYLLMAISFVISMYPAYIVQANVAWSECALIFVCWLLAWNFIDLNDNSSIIKFFLLGFLNAYAYIIHQRAIGILVASFLVISLMKLFKRINWKQYGMFILVLTVMFIIHRFIKNDIQSNNYLSNASININDFAGQIDKIKTIFTFNGFINTINIFLSHVYYIGAASFLLFFVGIYEILFNVKKDLFLFHNKYYNDINNNKFYLYTFLFLAFFLTISISAVFMGNPSRIDHIIYGRYNEMILGPIILLGFINLLSTDRINLNRFKTIIICFLFTTIITNLVLKQYNFTNYNRICVTGLLFKPYSLNGYNTFTSALIAILICSIVYLSFRILAKNKHLLSIALLCMAGIFFVTGESFVIFGIRGNGEFGMKKNFQNIKIADYIKENSFELPVYYLLGNDFNSNRPKDFYQFLLKDKSIICVTKEQLDLVKGDKYVIVGGFSNYLFQLSDEYDFCINAADSYLFISKTSIEVNAKELNGYNGIYIPLEMFHKKNVISEEFIQSNGIEGIFMYGPYINLNSGSYQFTIDIELIKSLNVNIGYIDIVSNIGQDQHFKKEINIIDFDTDNKLLLEVPLDLIESTNNIELRAYAYDGSQIKINNVQINKIY